LDPLNTNLLQNIQYLTRYKNFPYVVALSNQHEPEARSPQQLRAVLAIPDTIKVLGCDLKAPACAKQVVIELLTLMTPDPTVQRLIAVLEASI
jgi:hypothetical protein